MDKKLMGAIAMGVGISAVVGMMGAKKMHKSTHFGSAPKSMHRGYNHMMHMKDEFGSDLSHMAKKTGKTLIRAGRTVNRLAK